MQRAALAFLVLVAMAGDAHASHVTAPGDATDPANAPPSQRTAPVPSPAGPAPGDAPAAAPSTAAQSSQVPPDPAGRPAAAVPAEPGTGSAADGPASGAPSDHPPEVPSPPPAATSSGSPEAAVIATPGPPALPLPPSTARLAVSGVLGRIVDGPGHQDVGRVVDVLVDGAGQPRAAVIDFGGFMGLGSRKIAVEWGAFTFPPGGSDATLTIALSPEEIKNTPEYGGPGKPVTVVGPGTPAPRPGP